MDGVVATDSLLMDDSLSVPPGVYGQSVELLEYVLAGLGVGVVFGMFGAGGSAFATPVLALLGVPALLAVAFPSAAVGARLAQRISAERLRAAFGIMLIVFSIFFLVRELG
jgi:uncharacterized membrane protein YfcA